MELGILGSVSTMEESGPQEVRKGPVDPTVGQTVLIWKEGSHNCGKHERYIDRVSVLEESRPSKGVACEGVGIPCCKVLLRAGVSFCLRPTSLTPSLWAQNCPGNLHFKQVALLHIATREPSCPT